MDPNTNINPNPIAPESPSNPEPARVFTPSPISTDPPQPSFQPEPTASPVTPVSDSPQIITSEQPAAPPPAPIGAPSDVILPQAATPAPTVIQPQAGVSSEPTAPVVISGGFGQNTNAPPQPTSPLPVVSDPAQSPQMFSADTPPPPPPSSKKRRLKPLLIGLGAILIIAGGSAAAYFGVIVPNEPANVIAKAISNSLAQNQVTVAGNMKINATKSTPNITVLMTASKNTAENASDASINFNGYGVNVVLEARVVNQKLYLKAGDLSSLAALAGGFDPSYTVPAKTVSDILSNQWIQVDQSILDQLGVSCVLKTNISFSPADINQLQSDYLNHKFISVQKSSDATVNGQAATEYDTNIDDNKTAAFINNLGTLSFVKSLTSCNSGTTAGLQKAKGDNKQTPVKIWVDKATKRIAQIDYSGKPSASNPEQATIVFTFNYNPVTIGTPPNAKLATQVITELQKSLAGTPFDLSGIMGAGSTTGTSSIQHTLHTFKSKAVYTP